MLSKSAREILVVALANAAVGKEVADAIDSAVGQTITGAATSVVSADLPANKVLVSNASGKIASSLITSTELSNISGITSNVQNQLDDKLTKGSKTIFCIDNGDFATAQEAIDAASAGDTIIFGAKAGGWGNIVIPANKSLSLMGLVSPRVPTAQVEVGSITFSPTSGLNPNNNELHISNLFIDAVGGPAITFGGTAPARLRVTDCYIYGSSSFDTITLNNSDATFSSAYFYGCVINKDGSASNNLINSSCRYVVVNNCILFNGIRAINATAGLVEVSLCKIELASANEIIAISGAGTTVTAGNSLILNSTTNGSGVLIGTGSAFINLLNVFSIATGTGYCVRGSGTHLYGQFSTVNSVATPANVKIQNTVTSLPYTTAFTSAP